MGVYEPSMMFMQNNAFIHRAKKVKLWFKNHGITTIDWFLYLPDLNVIEHMWFKLKETVYQVCLDIENVENSKENITNVLFDALEKAWPLLNERLVDELIRNMKRRIETVIAAEGWYTRF